MPSSNYLLTQRAQSEQRKAEKSQSELSLTPSATTPIDSLAGLVKREARRLGFVGCRIVPAGEATHADFLDLWVAAGRPGEMGWLYRNGEKRRNPALLAEADNLAFASLIVLATPYHPYDLPDAVRDDPARGIIASYAWSSDYHDLIRGRLHALDAAIRAVTGRTSLGKGLVDSGPVLERSWAQESGIGFIGKNCCVIRPGAGSWLFLATLLVLERLQPDPPPISTLGASPERVFAGLPGDGVYGKWIVEASDEGDRLVGGCGRCTRCLVACPTDAFVGPYHLDPQRCISYWTIEASEAIPRELRRAFGNRIFGCDICQEVCPWNHRQVQREVDPAFNAAIDRAAPPLLEGFDAVFPYWLNDAAFAERFRKSPIKRAKRSGMLRNVCVALGNWGNVAALPALALALEDESPLARSHAAWALGELLRRERNAECVRLLEARQRIEASGTVLEELALALGDGR